MQEDETRGRMGMIRDAVQRSAVATLDGGGILAGNLAYMLLVTMMPLAILITAIAGLFGRTDAGRAAIGGILASLPHDLQTLFGPIIAHVVEARTGLLLWAGGLVALWTVSGFVGTLRQVVYRAYEAEPPHGFVGSRLRSMGGTLMAMALIILSFLVQIVFTVLLHWVARLFPYARQLLTLADLTRGLSFFLVFLAIWVVLKILTPRAHRAAAAWPGALATAVVWVGGTILLGPVLARFTNFGLTYGALSSVMIAMLFFHVIGFAFVFGAELNAKLAKERNRSYEASEPS